MRIAVMSDIHGNIYSLIKVLEDIDSQNVDTIICLGDLVGYGAHPNEVIALIKKRNILSLKGNYDASVVDNDFTYIRDTKVNSFSLPWTACELRASNKYFLDNLPTSITLDVCDKKIQFVHGSPLKINEYLTEDYENLNSIMNDYSNDILVCAHTHVPYIKNFGSKTIVNAGSVGKPKNGSPDATYVLLDLFKDAALKATIKTVSYEYHKTIKDMTMKNFPTSLIKSYETGLE